ncbi:N-succinylarginine dihydrolase [Planctomicrobium sp. SH661]|uniref:N-succinylarginine dihydrolase n=1 Tax=Planctomicrobium sp. SH661 TaxID=3448124 RepID=UPI003F5C3815
MNAFEVNFDGIVGPTHHYGGLAAGNLASQQHQRTVSHPKAAALQGLAKMKLLADLGLKQAVLPPQPRPHWGFLERYGFSGTAAEIIEQVAQQRPELLSIAYSASSMWAANAATVSPSPDTADGRVHFTPANLISAPHRMLESEATTQLLRTIFHDHHHFVVYDPLPHDELLADEGAANHTRLCRSHSEPGVELFVYGRDAEADVALHPVKYPARQTRLACERIAALHQLDHERRFFAQQTPAAIDAGVFHNDVIAVGNENVFLCHEQAFVDQPDVLQKLRSALKGELYLLEIPAKEFSLEEAVSTYLFNSQLVTLPGEPKRMLLLCPDECENHLRARKVLDAILAGNNPVGEVRFVNVRQSMQNGGGPACLRLRVPLTERELQAMGGNLLLTDTLYDQLTAWVDEYYRDVLTLDDLADPQLAEEVEQAMDAVSGILHL